MNVCHHVYYVFYYCFVCCTYPSYFPFFSFLTELSWKLIKNVYLNRGPNKLMLQCPSLLHQMYMLFINWMYFICDNKLCWTWTWTCWHQLRTKKQDRRWNADKPSATINPNTINHFASQSQTCQLLRNFFFFFFYVQTVNSDAISGWTDEDQLQIWSSHYSSSNNYLHYLLEVRMHAMAAWGQ